MRKARLCLCLSPVVGLQRVPQDLPVLAQGRAQQGVRPDLQADGVPGDGAACLAEQHAAGVAVHLCHARRKSTCLSTPEQ